MIKTVILLQELKKNMEMIEHSIFEYKKYVFLFKTKTHFSTGEASQRRLSS
jgi:hypothetical protein